jgi:rhodanese-related sulfurtransferase
MKNMLFLLFISCSISAFAQKTLDKLLNQYNTQSIPYVSVQELRRLQTNDTVIILDSREPSEYAISHLNTARFIGFNHFSSEEISEEIEDKDAPIIVYCSLGIRSEEIGEKLKKAGFTNVKNLYGGIFEWKNAGYPVINSEGKETDTIHTYSKAWSKWLLKGEKVYN